jgi:hypothetical protein
LALSALAVAGGVVLHLSPGNAALMLAVHAQASALPWAWESLTHMGEAGFVLVDMRVKKLLKRFLATPLRHGDFLLSVMLSRLLFMLPEILALLLFSRFLFGVTVRGSYGELALLVPELIDALGGEATPE